jgi:hypothetical protein
MMTSIGPKAQGSSVKRLALTGNGMDASHF